MSQAIHQLVAAARDAETVLAEQHNNCGGGEDTIYHKPLQDLRAALAAFPAPTRTVATEFPDYNGDLSAILKALGTGWHDSSWRNDACPSVSNERLGLFLFADYIDPAKREYPYVQRFALGVDGARGILLSSNEFQDVLDYLAKHYSATNSHEVMA